LNSVVALTAVQQPCQATWLKQLNSLRAVGTVSTTRRGVLPPPMVAGGWIETYWTPMKEILETGKLSARTHARVRTDRARIRSGHFRRKLSREA